MTMTHPTNFLNRRAAIYDPGTHQFAPAAAVLRRMASQEHCDGEPYDTMQAAAEYIDHLEHTLAIYEHGMDAAMTGITKIPLPEREFFILRDVFSHMTQVLDTTALDRVRLERYRQAMVEKFTPEHDDAENPGVILQGGINYLVAAMIVMQLGGNAMDPDTPAPMNQMIGGEWPFSPEWWKPGTVERMLEKGLAMGLAEYERHLRAAARAPAQEGEG